jgi:hydroxysqualene dehydroxylase
MHVVIVGAGWSGLAAAIELSHHGIEVALIKAAKRVGGRARRVEAHAASYDNGQHLMVGAGHEMLRLPRSIGVPEEQVFHLRPLRLEMRAARNAIVCVNFPVLPAPWHVLSGFANAS